MEALTNVNMVACGFKHSIALTDKGKIWSWGSNDSGQTGLPIFDYYFSDGILLCLLSNIVLTTLIEEYESDEEDNDSQFSGNDTESEWISPQVIGTMSNITIIATGREHSLAIVKSSYVPIQFAKDDNDEALYMWLDSNAKLRSLDDDAFKASLQSIFPNTITLTKTF